MSSRSRILLYGSAGLLVLAGGTCAAVFHGLTAQLATFVLISVGIGGGVLLLFLEVGFSEDRQRARDEGRRRARTESLRRTPTLRRHLSDEDRSRSRDDAARERPANRPARSRRRVASQRPRWNRRPN